VVSGDNHVSASGSASSMAGDAVSPSGGEHPAMDAINAIGASQRIRASGT
jgi:hypothetical protein